VPLISFILYIVLSCLNSGLENKFNPDQLLQNVNNCFFVTVFETIVIKIGIFISNNKNLGFFDVLSLAGYKYAGMCIIVLIRLLTAGNIFYYLKYPFEIYFCVTSFFIIYRSIMDIESHHGPTSTLGVSQESRKFVIGLGIL